MEGLSINIKPFSFPFITEKHRKAAQQAPEGLVGPFIIRWVVPVPGMPGQKRLHSFILVLPVDRQGNNWLI